MGNELNKYYKNDIKIIKKFLSERPRISGCYCYGIGESLSKRMYKLILISNDIWKWQYLNNKKNETTKYINFLSNQGYGFVEYDGIRENNCIFDYILMSESELTDILIDWKYITFAEIFQRPFITIKSKNRLDSIIMRNQKNALTTSLLMLNSDKASFFETMIKLYCISGCISSEKITLVNENYQMLKSIYEKYDLFNIDCLSKIKINNDVLNKQIPYLPAIVQKRIYEYNGKKEAIGVSNYFERQLVKEKEDIDMMRYLVNGFIRIFDYNGRDPKTKLLKRSNRI